MIPIKLYYVFVRFKIKFKFSSLVQRVLLSISFDERSEVLRLLSGEAEIAVASARVAALFEVLLVRDHKVRVHLRHAALHQLRLHLRRRHLQ